MHLQYTCQLFQAWDSYSLSARIPEDDPTNFEGFQIVIINLEKPKDIPEHILIASFVSYNNLHEFETWLVWFPCLAFLLLCSCCLNVNSIRGEVSPRDVWFELASISMTARSRGPLPKWFTLWFLCTLFDRLLNWLECLTAPRGDVVRTRKTHCP